MKKLLLVLLIVIAIFGMTACKRINFDSTNKPSNLSFTTNNGANESTNTSTNSSTYFLDQDTELSFDTENLPLKTHLSEAEPQIIAAMKRYIREAYGDQVVDCKIRVTKMYTAEEEAKLPQFAYKYEYLKDMELPENEEGEPIDASPIMSPSMLDNDLLFEVSYDLLPVSGFNTELFLYNSGKYDEVSGWVLDKHNVGILSFDGEKCDISSMGDSLNDF